VINSPLAGQKKREEPRKAEDNRRQTTDDRRKAKAQGQPPIAASILLSLTIALRLETRGRVGGHISPVAGPHENVGHTAERIETPGAVGTTATSDTDYPKPNLAFNSASCRRARSVGCGGPSRTSLATSGDLSSPALHHQKRFLVDARQPRDPIITLRSHCSLAPHDETILVPVSESAFVRTIGRSRPSGTRESSGVWETCGSLGAAGADIVVVPKNLADHQHRWPMSWSRTDNRHVRRV
jgi:hypothetical protein